MKKQSKYKAGYRVLPQHKLIYEFRSGTPSNYDAFSEYFKHRVEKEDYNTEFDVIVDTSRMCFDFIIDNIIDYGNQFEKKSKMALIKKIAVIAPDPNQKAFNIGMTKTFVSATHNKIFNDIESALDWLGKPEAKKDLLAAIKDLKENPDFTAKG